MLLISPTCIHRVHSHVLGLARRCLNLSHQAIHCVALQIVAQLSPLSNKRLGKRRVYLATHHCGGPGLVFVAMMTYVRMLMAEDGARREQDAQTIVGLFLDDNDPRVRSTALSCLFTLVCTAGQ